MTDAMFPEPIFPPAISMVSTDQHRAIAEAIQHGLQLVVDPFQASPLPPGTLSRTAMLVAEGNTGTGPTLPASAFVPIGHMSFSHI